MSVNLEIEKMKSVKLAVALSLLFLSSLALATQPKTTLTVERIIVVGNGTSSGKSITSHTIVKRFFDEADCLAAKNVYNAQNTVTIGPNALNADVSTKADCEALDHSTSMPAGY